MEYSSEHLGGTLRFYLSGKLTFSDNGSFQKIAAASGQQGVQHIELYLDKLEYIDSSGIGMLLVLKEKCDEARVAVTILHPGGQVAKVLRVACIDRIIPISG